MREMTRREMFVGLSAAAAMGGVVEAQSTRGACRCRGTFAVEGVPGGPDAGTEDGERRGEPRCAARHADNR